MMIKGEPTNKRHYSNSGHSSIVYKWRCTKCGDISECYYKKKCKCEPRRAPNGKSRIFICKYCGRFAVAKKGYTMGQIKYCTGGNCAKADRMMISFAKKEAKPKTPKRVFDKSISKQAPKKRKVIRKELPSFASDDCILYDSRIAGMMGQR